MKKLLLLLVVGFLSFAFLNTQKVSAFETTITNTTFDSDYQYDGFYDAYNHYEDFNADDIWALIAVFSIYAVIIGSIVLVAFAYNAAIVYTLAKKLGFENRWRAFIPVFQESLFIEMGGFNPWFALLVFIPFFGNITVGILSIISWFRVTEKRGFPSWVALIATFGWIVPSVGNLALAIAQGYVAWGEYKK